MGKELLKNEERRTKTNTYVKQFSGPEEITEPVVFCIQVWGLSSDLPHPWKHWLTWNGIASWGNSTFLWDGGVHIWAEQGDRNWWIPRAHYPVSSSQLVSFSLSDWSCLKKSRHWGRYPTSNHGLCMCIHMCMNSRTHSTNPHIN